MIVLGIETSCDETGVAVYDGEAGLRSHCLYSQIRTHAPFGGIVPELASRDHIRKLMPLVQQAMAEAEIVPADLDGVAYTAGPGLVGALLVGATTAVGLGLAWDLPIVPVHHMEAHLLAVLLEPDPPAFPFLALLVSGGHSMLVQVEGLGKYRILGETLDDAVGEAFDKGAKLLGLPYPGGPHLARLAAEGRPGLYRFPRPMSRDPGLDFSFSGLKTALAVRLRELERDGPVSGEVRADLANAYQEALVDSLVAKTAKAVETTGLMRVVVAGGVGANQLLRTRLRTQLGGELATPGAAVYYPRAEFCTDNAAMVALTGCLRLTAGMNTGGNGPEPASRLSVEARARWSLEEL